MAKDTTIPATDQSNKTATRIELPTQNYSANTQYLYMIYCYFGLWYNLYLKKFNSKYFYMIKSV